MKARPILMSAPMVLPCLSGTKTQTRRTAKCKPYDLTTFSFDKLYDQPNGIPQASLTSKIERPDGIKWLSFPCPYGKPGDLLWVRETCRAEELSRPQTWRKATAREGQMLKRTEMVELDELDGADGVRYLADGIWHQIDNTPSAGEAWCDLFHYRGRGKSRVGNTVPGIHMPRWASRLTLEITEVRIERLQDISEEDALAEGVIAHATCGFHVPGVEHPNKDFPILSRPTAREMYAALWDTINGSGEWLGNPWVWVVAFKAHQKNVGEF